MGLIVQRAWFDLPNHYPHVLLDAICLMPNHIHGIIILMDDHRRGGSGLQSSNLPDQILAKSNIESRENQTRPYTRHGLSEIVRAIKSFSARRINRLRNTIGVPVWQRNFYERIIRDGDELEAIREYIFVITSSNGNWTAKTP